MLFRTLRIILLGVALACLMPWETCVAGGYPYQKFEPRPHHKLEHHSKLHSPPPRAAIIESAVIRRVARPLEEREDAPRPDSDEQSLEDRVTKLENNFKQLNEEVSRLADLLQRQIDILDKTR